jgi:hypothetical protein
VSTDGGQEVIAARFVHPDAILAEFRAGEITLMPPQFYIAQTLASILRGSTTTADQRARVEELARGAFGNMVINPQPLGPPDGQGRVVLTYEGDHTRGGPEGRLHRATILAGKGGVRISHVNVTCSSLDAPQVTSEIILERNFDIFKDVDVVPSKL